ncbi:MAG: acid phosphatase pho5 [Piccolia ochrophora]|nr:MAG: acid phosphatase pho5 [Piccolia ochrophora]
MARRVVTLSAFVFLIGAIFFLSRRSTQLPLPPAYSPNGANEPFSLAAFYTGVPYTSSWGSWWHPQRLRPTGSGLIGKGWNLLYHLGGNGPWIEKVDGVVEGGIGTPDECVVDQVHMMSRHAERFPTKAVGGRMLDLLDRMRSQKTKLKGDLEFVNSWEYFTSEQLTTTGPFAGTLEAFTTGVKLRTRYDHLVGTSSASPKTNFWASDCDRVIDTARYFGAGFFGLDWESTAKLHVIPETEDRGGNTLTPGDTCVKYRTDLKRGHDHGAEMLAKFRATYLPAIADRLEKQNPHIRFTDAEIYSMQETCGFETLVRGSSRWCDVFSRKEWENFEYARDVIHFYRAGPGNPYGPTMGHLWLNATTNLLRAGPTAGPLFFSLSATSPTPSNITQLTPPSVHDGDIVPLLAAVALPTPLSPTDLPITHRPTHNPYETSQLVPMGGRIIFERLTCSSRSSSRHSSPPAVAVRVNINDGVVAIPGCDTGPGRSCPLEEFEALVERRGREVGDFRKVCGLGGDSEAAIGFLHQ